MVELTTGYKEAFTQLLNVNPHGKELVCRMSNQIDILIRKKHRIVVFMHWNETISLDTSMFNEAMESKVDKPDPY